MGEKFAAVELDADPRMLAEDVSQAASADEVIRRHLLAPPGLSIPEIAAALAGKIRRVWEAA